MNPSHVNQAKSPVAVVTLDPWQHVQAVRHFFAHFGLVERAADVHFLERLLRAFAQIPYENISKILKLNQAFDAPDRIRLPEEVMEGYVRHHLGGTCFSLSYFLHAILTQVGFVNYIVMADMGQRRHVHCALMVHIEGKKYLVDPGYLLTHAMQLDKDKVRWYRSPHSGIEVRFDRQSERFLLSTFDQQVVKLRYSFYDRPCPLTEFLQHWYASFYQGTMHSICLTQLRQEGMIYIHDDYLQIATASGKRKQKLRENYHQVIAEIFSIHPDWVAAAQEAIVENMRLEKIKGIYRPQPK